jgi:hypothetical protein
MTAPDDLRKHADSVLTGAANALGAAGIPAELTIDRLLTIAAAMAVSNGGAAHAAEEFRAAADRVASGAFAKFEPARN